MTWPARALLPLAAGWGPIAGVPAYGQAATEATGEVRSQASTGVLGDIIVTARRRAEPLQRTPISVVALTAEDLESRSVTNTRTLQNFIPNLTFAPSQNVGEAAGNVFIRGIGQEDFGIGAEPGVGIYLDGVYYARPLGLIMNLTDIARIEVLRGPQGTLFGKNSIGGAINIISNLPGPERERRARLLFASYDRIEFRAVSSEPLSRTLFARLSMGIFRQNGHVRRLPPPSPPGPIEEANRAPIDSRREGTNSSQSARLQLRWQPSDSFTADMSVDGSRRRGSQGATHVDAVNLGVGIFPLLNGLIRAGRLPGPEITEDSFPDSFLVTRAGGDNFVDQNLWGASATLTREVGTGSLKFIGAYRGLESHVGTDTDGLHFNIAGSEIRVDQQQLSGELQLSGTTSALAYTAGVFAIGEEARVHPAVSIQNEILLTCGCFQPPGNRVFTSDRRDLEGASYAGYAQWTLRISDRLGATVGARYTHEQKSIEGKAFRLAAGLQPTDEVVDRGSNRDSWNAFTYRAGLEFQATRDLMAYGSVAKGFKSGGFNVRGSPELPNMGFYSFKPETALTYEIGLRSEWFGRKLRFNATLFHSDYRDIQIRQQTLVDGMVATLIENAAKARIRGGEVELAVTPLDGLKISAAYGHLDPRYLDVGRVAGLTLSSRFQRTPRHTLSASVDYDMLVAAGTLEFHGDYSYRSKEQFQITPAVNDQQSYGLLGARVTYRSRGDRWAFAVFVTNLTDEPYRTAGRGTLIDQAGFAYSSIGMPRQLGVQLTTTF